MRVKRERQRGGEIMKDLMAMSYDAYKMAVNEIEGHVLFAEMFLEEIKKMKGADIAPHLSVVFDKVRAEYKVTLTFPVSFFDKLYSSECDIE